MGELLRLIVVDDEESSLLITKEIMSYNDKSLDIRTSCSPLEVLEWVRDNPPDCVISDFRMPEMNGIEFTRRLRESSRVPVILYTNQSIAEVAEEAFEAGVDDYVRKDDDARHFLLLRRRVQSVVDRHRMKLLLNQV